MINKIKAKPSRILIYADGSSLGNPGPGGYAATTRAMDGNNEVDSLTVTGGSHMTTNSKMEMMAVIAALDALAEPSGTPIVIRSDSQMLIKGASEWLPNWIKHNWRRADKRPVANVDLWKRIAAHIEALEITWEWEIGRAHV